MSHARVLLVEDSDDDVDLTLMAFRKLGLTRVAVARDGVLALDYLFGRGEYSPSPPPLPKVVLLDLNLPKIDGFDVLRAIRSNERTAALPVVILTSSREERDRLEGYASGANSYVRKPVDLEDFEETAKQLGRYWLEVNETVSE